MGAENMDNLSSLQAQFQVPAPLDIKSVGNAPRAGDNMSMARDDEDREVSKFNRDFRARVKALRLQADYTQDEFADLLRLSRVSYPKYETRSLLPLHAIPRLALVTKESVEFIVTGKNPKAFRPRLVK